MLFLVVLTMAILFVNGFRNSRRERQRDQKHFAAFVGFSAGIVAIVATLTYFVADLVWFSARVAPNDHPTRQGITFIFMCIGLFSSLVAFLAGFLSGGIRRVTLILFGPVMAVIYVLAAFSNFGA